MHLPVSAKHFSPPVRRTADLGVEAAKAACGWVVAPEASSPKSSSTKRRMAERLRGWSIGWSLSLGGAGREARRLRWSVKSKSPSLWEGSLRVHEKGLEPLRPCGH